MIPLYFRLEILSDEIRANNKIKSKARLDCVSFYDSVPGGYKGLEPFKNSKGQLFFYKTPARDIVEANSKRISEWSLTNSSLNFSSIYIEDFDFPEYGYGYPNANRLLSNRNANPLFNYRNDGYLFIVNADYSVIELLIIPDGRNLISGYSQKLIDGGFDDELKRLRNEAKPFYNYLRIDL